MYFQQIEFATPAYDEAVGLRYRVLRKPLGLEFTTAFLAAEWDQFHLAAYSDRGVLLAYLNLTPQEAGIIKMRQVAVEPELQGKGVGKALVEYAEQFALDQGFKQIVLNARDTAVPFYLKSAYTVEGEQFTEVGIPHFRMYKNL
ncbi:MAG: GNAT family N-acetyltransferase [Chitinophagales bacterium]|nr:GNAT family N-acetyltransferase [Chitinophagales bacterium]